LDVKALAHTRISRLLTLAVVALWLANVTAAGAAFAPAMHCHGANMPCCPPTSSSMARCLDSDCIEQVPQKAEAQLDPQPAALLIPAALQSVTPQPVHEPLQLLHAGVRFQAAVFRLKDDLRI
jgi:hypothetical protein